MTVELLSQHHLVFLSLKGDCTGSSESTLDKMQYFWKSHDTAQLLSMLILISVSPHSDFCQKSILLNPYSAMFVTHSNVLITLS